MKKTMQVDVTDVALWLDTDITYAHVPGWFAKVTTDLKMSVIWHSIKSLNRPMKAPCIVWVCGGGWQDMNVDAHLAEFTTLAKHGYVIASVQYRTSNVVKFPAQLEDIKAAIRYLRAHAEFYHIDPDRIAIMGESAGGHLAAMAGVTNGMKEFDKGEYLDYSSDVQAVCDWYGPTDFLNMDKSGDPSSPYCLLAGCKPEDRDALAKTCPVTYVSDKTPPFLILHGNNDVKVNFHQSELLYDQLTAHHVPVDFYELEGAGHGSIHFFQPQIKEIIQGFFDRTLHHEGYHV